tara:strand:- start:137 stop:625 length:489 start_codon:yes stop_codon:yes gene_type:complete
MNKQPIGERTIRFQDCDPYGHLNNSKYLDYMINVREDHLIHEYDINIFEMAQVQKKAWVVGHNDLIYMRPALVMEKVKVKTALIDFNDRYVQAEMIMTNEAETHIKAVLWTKFYHFDIAQQRGIRHTEEQMELFKEMVLLVEQQSTEERAKHLATALKVAVA